MPSHFRRHDVVVVVVVFAVAVAVVPIAWRVMTVHGTTSMKRRRPPRSLHASAVKTAMIRLALDFNFGFADVGSGIIILVFAL